MNLLFYLLLPIYAGFCLWLGARILNKAGIDPWWTFVLLIPVVNIILLWIFAFSPWPALRDDLPNDY